MTQRKYTAQDVGCYADGLFGPEHIRARLADLAEGLISEGTRESLLGPMPDDAWDEQEALDALNEHLCCDDIMFELDMGELHLVRV